MTALGGGVLAMAVVACLVPGAAIGAARPASRAAFLAGVAAGAWLSVMVAATVVCLLLAAAHTIPLSGSLPSMLSAHALVGLGEAAVTVLVVALVTAGVPGVVAAPGAPGVQLDLGPRSNWTTGRARAALATALVAAVALAGLAAPFASALPDRLDHVALSAGVPAPDPHPVAEAALLPDYAMPGVGDARVATGLAGAIGTLLLAGVAAGGAVALVRRPPRTAH